MLITNNKSIQLIYDTQPIPRPYSTLTSLRKQWGTEQEKMEDISSVSFGFHPNVTQRDEEPNDALDDMDFEL